MCTHARCAGRHHARAAKATAHAARTRVLRRHAARQWQRLAHALRNARSGRARAPKAPPEWKGRPSVQRGQVYILMAKSRSRRNAGNTSTSVKSRGRRVFASGAGSRATCNKGGLLCVANARAPAGNTMEGSGRWVGRAGDTHATPHLEARAPGERVTAAHSGGPSRFSPASTLRSHGRAVLVGGC